MNVTLGQPLAASILLASLLALAASGVAASWADLWSITQERDAKADLLARGVVSRPNKDTVHDGVAAADPFLLADSETLAAGRLDALVRTTVADAGCALSSSQATAITKEPGVSGRIEALAVIEGQNDAMQAVLMRLETGTPMIFVDTVSLEFAEPSASATTDPRSPRLRMNLGISAYWKAGRP